MEQRGQMGEKDAAVEIRGYTKKRGRPKCMGEDEIIQHCDLVWRMDTKAPDWLARVVEAYGQKWT